MTIGSEELVTALALDKDESLFRVFRKVSIKSGLELNPDHYNFRFYTTDSDKSPQPEDFSPSADQVLSEYE